MSRRVPRSFAELRPVAAPLLTALMFALASPAARAQRPTEREGELGDTSGMESRQMRILIGQQKSLPAGNVAEYSIGLRGIVDVRVAQGGQKFILVGQQPGTTSLVLVYDNGRQVQYRITVTTGEEQTGVPKMDNIRLDFYFVQVAESYAHQLGIGYPASFGGNALSFESSLNLLGGPSFLSATAAISNQPLPRVDLLQTSGWARVMRQVALITVNGSSATFRSGGEVNIPVTQGLTAGVQKVNFGSRVQVQPRFDKETNRIQLRINANVSNLTEPGAGGNVPGRNVSNLNTVVNLKMGQSVVLAGLISESSRTSQSGLPGLSQIPILGVLFGSNQKQAESTQNLLFIVPTVVDVVSMNARERISDAFSVYWDYSGGIEDIKMLSTPEDIPSAARPEAKPLDELAEEANDEGDGDDDGGGGDDDGN